MSRRRHRRAVWPRLVAVGVAIGVVVTLAFFVRGFDSTGNDTTGLPPASSLPSSLFPASPPAPVKAKSKKGKSKTYVVPGGGGQTITLGAGGAGITISRAGEHSITLRVTSAAPIYGVGYLIPTSMDSPYGKRVNPGASWSLSTTVTGKPYYAILWIAAGASGAAATCDIYVDGRLAASHTTAAGVPYGREVCYA